MSRNPASAILHAAVRRMESTWAEVARDWQDEVAVRFASEFWEPLEAATARYAAALDELEAALGEAKNDC